MCRISTLHFYFSSLQIKRQRKMFEHQNAKRRTKRKGSVRYIFAKSIDIHIGLWYNKSTAKVACFSPFSPLCRDNTFDNTLAVEWG